MTGEFVLALGEIDPGQRMLVGGKAAHLAALKTGWLSRSGRTLPDHGGFPPGIVAAGRRPG